MRLDDLKNSRVVIVAVVYLSLLLDNVLLTVVGNYDQAVTRESRREEDGRRVPRVAQLADPEMFQCRLFPITCARSTRT